MRLLTLPCLMFAATASLPTTVPGAAEPVRVAIVIDDGPVPEAAKGFLELFEREGVRATFAYVARTAGAHPETARAAIAAGHEVMNHSFAHLHPRELDDAALEQEIVGAQRTLHEVLALSPRWYWPPFLELDDRMPALFTKAGITRAIAPALASSEDWNRSVSADEIHRRATTGITDGTVVLFHEWRAETLARMPGILAELKRQGCTFHTFSELDRLVRAKP